MSWRAAAPAMFLAAAAPAALHAQPAPPELSQGRTGPQATPPAMPAFAEPRPSLAPPQTDRPAVPAPGGGAPITELQIAVPTPPSRPAVPPPGWRPPADSGGLRMEHRAGEALDEGWLRRQFELNGLPGGGAPQALAVVQLVNRAFLGAGFINSGVVVRPSTGPNVLSLAIVYGGLVPFEAGAPPVSVEWIGGRSKGLDAAYVEDRMPSARRRPLSAVELERDFRLLAEDAAVRTINADLRPGARPGEASLGLAVTPQDRFDLYLSYANNRSPSVGGERLALGGLMRNVVGPGDRLSVEGGLTDGVEDATVAYAFPFVSPRTTISVRGSFNNAAVVDPRLAPLDIKAKDLAFEAGVTRKLLEAPLLPSSQPGRWTSARTLSVGAMFAWRESKAYLLGERFSFAPGAVDGRTEYRALRLVGDYVVRNVDQVFAVSVTATRGLDGTRPDIADPDGLVPDMDFHAVLAQVNYARRLSRDGLELRARAYGQWSDGVLYSGERFSAGGETTVRGYRENALLTDRGLVGSLELAKPIHLGRRRTAGRAFDWGAFTASTFVDGAYMTNAKAAPPDRQTYAVGVSLAWVPADVVSARITYAKALSDVESAGRRDIQDRGFSFRLTVRPLLVF